MLSSPIILILPLKPTGRRIYEEIWAIAHNILKKDGNLIPYDQLWWNQKDWKEKMNEARYDGGLKPFVLKTVDR